MASQNFYSSGPAFIKDPHQHKTNKKTDKEERNWQNKKEFERQGDKLNRETARDMLYIPPLNRSATHTDRRPDTNDKRMAEKAYGAPKKDGMGGWGTLQDEMNLATENIDDLTGVNDPKDPNFVPEQQQ